MKNWKILLTSLLAILSAPPASADTTIIFQNNYIQPLKGFQLLGSSPYNYQKFTTSPEHITLRFSQPVLEEKSYIKVYDAFGQQLNDVLIETHGNNMSVPIPNLRKGRYKVKWQAQCQCEEKIRLGDVFRFIIR